MARIATTRGLLEALKAEGHELPADCAEVKIVMDVNASMMIRYTCHMDRELVAKVGRALARMGSD